MNKNLILVQVLAYLIVGGIFIWGAGNSFDPNSTSLYPLIPLAFGIVGVWKTCDIIITKFGQ